MQSAIPASVIRGGTSRGLFLRLSDLPEDPAERDSLMLELLGSPDPIQVDGLGGGHSHTSKVMAVGSSPEDDVDVDYLFAQVDVRQPVVDYGGNCGNLTAAVAVYAIDEGLVDASEGDETTVMLRCLNTSSKIRVTVPVEGGMARVQGDFEMAGIAHSGAEIRVDYLDPEGEMLGRGPLPDGGNVVTTITPEGHKKVQVSIVDVTSPLVIVRAADLGLYPPFSPEELNRDEGLLAWIEAIRAECAFRLGIVDEPDVAALVSPSQPKVALCAPPTSYVTSVGRSIAAREVDVVAAMSSVQRIHHAFAGTGTMCLAAATRIPGTMAERLAGPSNGSLVRVGHPKGVAEASVILDESGRLPRIVAVGVSRTARLLMRGQVYHRTPGRRGGPEK